jgi:branched-chain amino acid transport system permease protein
MSGILVLEQLLNGLGYGLMLFLLAAGLTLVFGIMDVLNLAHGSLFMAGAYVAAVAHTRSGSFTARCWPRWPSRWCSRCCSRCC